MSRLLVVAPNWLGDAIMALPAIADVRRAFPAAEVAIAARRSVAPLFAMAPGVDETIPGVTRRARADVALLLPNSFRSAWSVLRAGVPERWGYRTDWRGRLLTRAVDRPARVHQVEYYQHLVRALGVPTGDATPRLEVPQASRDAAAALLRLDGWTAGTPLVGLAPGAAYGGAKRWPPEYFAEVARALANDGARTVVVGTAADAGTVGEMMAALGSGDEPINLVGRTSLETLAGVLAACRTVVSNDSGAMHLAAAIGVPVVAIFGPTDEAVTSPGSPSALSPPRLALLTHPVWCRPCLLRECPIDHRCMREMAPSRVLRAVREAACL